MNSIAPTPDDGNTAHREMIGKGAEFTYEQWVAAGWTEGQLIAHGYMSDDRRPVIRIEGGALFRNAKTLADLLTAKNLVVRHHKILVRADSIRVVPAPANLGAWFEASWTPVSWTHATAAWLRCELMSHFRFEKYDGRSKAWLPADCPKDLVSLLVRDSELFFPHKENIAAIAVTP